MKKRRSFAEELSGIQLLEVDACTQGGECLKHCPVQEVTGNPAIAPPEKIRLFREFLRSTDGLRARLFGPRAEDRRLLEDFTRALFECTTCGACGRSCPVGIFTQRLWPALRKEMVRRGLGPIGPQAAMPGLIARTGNPYDKPAAERYAPWLPSGAPLADRAPLAYYAGCTGAYEAQPMVRGDVELLAAVGEPFVMLPPEEEVCCGFPLFITGRHDTLRGLVARLVSAYRERGVGTLVCSCPCCVNIMARDCPLLLGAALPFRIRHVSQHVADALASGRLRLPRGPPERLIYPDRCYLARGVGVIEEPRAVLRAIPGVRVLEFEHHGLDTRCCGAGGAARKVHHENAIAMARLSWRGHAVWTPLGPAAAALAGMGPHPYDARRFLNDRHNMLSTIRGKAKSWIVNVLFGFPAPILLALVFNEIRDGLFKRFSQTISYMPHFVSWIVFAALITGMLSPSTGAVNWILQALGQKPIYFMANPGWFRVVLIASDIWKEIGWGAIIYLAALTDVDPTLYEAAIVDGASRIQRMISRPSGGSGLSPSPLKTEIRSVCFKYLITI